MREGLAMRAALIAAVAVTVLVGPGCEQEASNQRQIQESESAELELLQQRLDAVESTLEFRFGPGDSTRANISVDCNVTPPDPCSRKLEMLREHRICAPGGTDCPTQVRWQVSRFGSCWDVDHDAIRIVPKSGQLPCFPTLADTIAGPASHTMSGQADAQCSPTEPPAVNWFYSVELVNDTCTPDVVHSIDPVVIIEPY